MIRLLTTTDRWLGQSRPGWLWLGQLGLVLLGVHRAADRLDDLLAAALVSVRFTAGAARAAMWGGVMIELLTAAVVVGLLVRGLGGTRPSWRAAWTARPLAVLSVPLFWLVSAAAGATAVGIAVGELVGALSPPVGVVAAGVVAGLTLWRLGWTGWERVLAGLPTSGGRWEGAVAAPALLLMATAAAWSLPVWGWLA